jgi:hypothetical protein
MLSDYQREVIACLQRHELRFLVVGGQGRRLGRGDTLHDVDVWTPFEESRSRLARFAAEWLTARPQDLFPGWLECFHSSDLKSLQLKVPDAHVLYADKSGETVAIEPTLGVDIVAGNDRYFDACFERAVLAEVDGLALRCISMQDHYRMKEIRRMFWPEDFPAATGT